MPSDFNPQTGTQDTFYDPQPGDSPAGIHGHAAEDTAENDAISAMQPAIIANYQNIVAIQATQVSQAAAILALTNDFNAISATSPPSSITAPTITGQPIQTVVLTGSVGSWTGVGNTYAWKFFRDGSAISGALGTGTVGTYTLVSGDVGHAITFGVTATNTFGTSTQALSGGTAFVTASSAATYTASTPPTTATVGSNYNYQLAATGSPAPTWAITAGTLPVGLNLNASTGLLSGIPTTTGSSTFSFQAQSSGGNASAVPVTIVVSGALVLPAFTVDSPPAAVIGTAYGPGGAGYQFTATGVPTPTTYTVSSGSLPPGLNLSSGGLLTGTPTTTGTYNFVASTTTTAGIGFTPTLTINVTSTVLNVPVNTVVPYLSGVLQVGMPLQFYPGNWTNPVSGTPTYQFQVVRGSTTIVQAFSSTSTYTPVTADVGNTLTVYCEATNTVGTSAPVAAAITPAIAAAGSGGGSNLITNAAISNTTTAADFVPHQFTATLSIDTSRTWTTDALLATFTDSLSGWITPSTFNTAPVTAGSTYTCSMQAQIGSGNTGLTSGNCTIDWFQSDGTTFISNTAGTNSPLNSTAQTTLTVTAIAPAGAAFGVPQFNSNGAVASGDTLFLGNISLATSGTTNLPQFLNETPPTSLAGGTSLTYAYVATGTGTVSYIKGSGIFPAGLSLSSTGVLSGAPSSAGTYTWTVMATDPSGSSLSTPTTMIVSAPPTGAPVFANQSAPGGSAGAAYSYQYTFSNGALPITTTVGSGSLPTGLSLSTDGLLSGNPTAGSYTYQVKATNSASTGGVLSATQNVTISTVTTNIPAAPNGPTPPGAGYRRIFADDFNGSALSNFWALNEFGNSISTPNNKYELANYDPANISVGSSHLVLSSAVHTTTLGDGVTRLYTGAACSTGAAASPFLVSPSHAGTLYFEAKVKNPGGATGSDGGVFPAFWITTFRHFGDSSNNNVWTREMDFFEFGLSPGPGSKFQMDAGQQAPNAYGSGSPSDNNPHSSVAISAFDPSAAFHVYTAQVNSDGSFSVWVDGTHYWDFGAYTAIDWMGIVFDYSLVPGGSGPFPTGFTGDQMVIEYCVAWQDAGVTAGSGIIGGGTAPGTV